MHLIWKPDVKENPVAFKQTYFAIEKSFVRAKFESYKNLQNSPKATRKTMKPIEILQLSRTKCVNQNRRGRENYYILVPNIDGDFLRHPLPWQSQQKLQRFYCQPVERVKLQQT